MSASGTALLRALLNRAGTEQDRILLSNICSTDWQSLTFTGERHQLGLVVRGPGPHATAGRIIDGLEDAELDIGRGRFVADISCVGNPTLREDGSLLIELEALTVQE